jgi:indole-3-glycerol phosphate synthase
MNNFVKTDTILDKILAQKVEEVHAASASAAQIEAQARAAVPVRDFIAALHSNHVALIAEIKKASPSRGVLIENFNPVTIGQVYAENGASAISVLTDEQFFQGQLSYLQEVRAEVKIPVLRKDFTIDPYQIFEACAAGADAILLIVMALEDSQLADLYALSHELGMAALVEVHNETEMERALKLGAVLIGINNRDLKTFHEDLNVTARLAQLVPSDVTLVAESAIRNIDDVRRMGDYGAHAVLVGESLVKAHNMALQVRDFSSQRRG